MHLEVVGGLLGGGLYQGARGAGGGGYLAGPGGLGGGLVVVGEQQRREAGLHVPADVVRQHPQEHVRPPVLSTVPDGSDVQVGIEGAEGSLDLGQGLVGRDDFQAVQVTGGDAGAQHVDAVELCLGVDGVLIAGVAQAVAGDLGSEVLSDLAAVLFPVHPDSDLILAAQRGAGPRARHGDLTQINLSGREQALFFRAHSAARNRYMQATSRSPGKSGEVISARSWTSNSDSCRSPPRTNTLTYFARSAVIQSRPSL